MFLSAFARPFIFFLFLWQLSWSCGDAWFVYKSYYDRSLPQKIASVNSINWMNNKCESKCEWNEMIWISNDDWMKVQILIQFLFYNVWKVLFFCFFLMKWRLTKNMFSINYVSKIGCDARMFSNKTNTLIHSRRYFTLVTYHACMWINIKHIYTWYTRGFEHVWNYFVI